MSDYPTDLDALRAAEREATPGPWTSPGAFEEDGQHFEEVLGGGVPGSSEEHQIAVLQAALNKRAAADARLIALMRNNLAALLDAAEAVARVRALHQPEECDCQNCDGEGMRCPECVGHWPCPTFRALKGADRD